MASDDDRSAKILKKTSVNKGQITINED